ncbi:hypothetical protein VNO77_33337 [Canavalia gladiata]|uniref:CDT1 Geminin-binding domain-containing protein n=1 Tax=Canavalia gladiata TaxID=3824 RepID=A0AAN9PYT8_CANGL
MDKKESLKDVLDFNGEKILEVDDDSISCPTPQKNAESLTIKSKEGRTQLPQKYQILADLFGHMSCSFRLQGLHKRTPTFQNICRQVEVLSKRKFSYNHLAQMKYIFPEGICIDKVLVHDKNSLCMIPDMKITLIFEVVEEHSDRSIGLAFRRCFNSKLTDFFNTHPEVTDVPEAILPEPFSQKTCSLTCESSHVEEFMRESSHVNPSAALLSTSNWIEMLPEIFQLYPSFSRHFSRKKVANQTEKIQCFSSSKTSRSSQASDRLDNQEIENVWQKGGMPLSDHEANLNAERGQPKESCSMSFQPSVINTTGHMICPPRSVCCNNAESPDMKNVSGTAGSLMTETPAQSAPQRLLPDSDFKLRNMSSQKSKSHYKPAKRVLDFSFVEGNNDLDIRVNKLESSRSLLELDSFSEYSRGCFENCNSSGSVYVPQEAEENLGYSPEKTIQNQVGLDTQHEKSSLLLNLVNVIHSIFQSVKRIPITKQELLQKILINSLDFVEIREVEEQVESLEKLVPDWICKKLIPTGDIMYCVKKVSDLDSVRSRLFSKVKVEVER